MALFRQSSSAGVLFSILVLSGWIHSNWAVQAQCVSNTWTIFNRESAVTDTSVQRSYTLCPNTNFSLGTYDYSYQIIRGTGTPMIPLRPNMSIKCGTDGSIHNNCIIKGGPVHLDGTNHFGFVNGTVENVVIQGVTFENAQRYMVWINKDGSVTFEECVFRGSRNATSPILLDYFDPINYNNELSVTFNGCIFNDNLFGGQFLQHSALETRPDSQPAVIVSNARQNRLIIQNSIFSNNNMVINNTDASIESTLVEASGPLTMTDNCFNNNVVGVAPVTAYDTASLFANNFQTNSNGPICAFAQKYDSYTQFENGSPTCLSFDATVCQASTNYNFSSASGPTYSAGSTSGQPASMPIAMPSVGPSSAPVNFPTMKPSAGQTTTSVSTPATALPTIHTTQTNIATVHPTTIAPSSAASLVSSTSLASKNVNFTSRLSTTATPTVAANDANFSSTNTNNGPIAPTSAGHSLRCGWASYGLSVIGVLGSVCTVFC